MSEKQPPIEKPRSEWPIEQQANFEGSWTNLMCERLRNLEIRKQIFDLLCEEEKDEINESKRIFSWLKELAISKGKKITPEVTENEKKLELRTKKTYEEFEKELDEKLEIISFDTPVSFDEGAVPHVMPYDRETIPAGFKENGMRVSTKEMNQIESHEKGHVLRKYKSSYLIKKFLKVVDISAIKFSEEESETGYKENVIMYFQNPMEITERMSQLKNYFGMVGNEKFTKDHLRYAKEHYITDVADNNMTKFFQAITPEKEDAFIELINSAGI